MKYLLRQPRLLICSILNILMLIVKASLLIEHISFFEENILRITFTSIYLLPGIPLLLLAEADLYNGCFNIFARIRTPGDTASFRKMVLYDLFFSALYSLASVVCLLLTALVLHYPRQVMLWQTIMRMFLYPMLFTLLKDTGYLFSGRYTLCSAVGIVLDMLLRIVVDYYTTGEKVALVELPTADAVVITIILVLAAVCYFFSRRFTYQEVSHEGA